MTDLAYIATRKGMFIVQRKPKGKDVSWVVKSTSFLGDNVTLVCIDPRDGSVYAALDHGHFGVKLHRSTDQGSTWTELAVPAYPEPPEGQPPEKCLMSGIEIPWKLKLIWALAPGGRDQSGRLWCGTSPGGLFRSDDAGQSWSLVRSLWDHAGRKQWFGGGLDYPAIHSICVDPRDADHLAIGVSCGGVWITHDGGESWVCKADGMRADYMPPDRANDPGIQDPHCLVQCKSSPDVFWTQHHNGIFKSEDGCASWREISKVKPSSFGFAVAVHPHDPDTAWFVPAIKDEIRIPTEGQVVVTRTTDGGQSFEILRDGLPQNHAYDLTFRHALDVDDTGERLMFGSTTGSLWVSENRGDTWMTISCHLPPVHAVRFNR